MASKYSSLKVFHFKDKIDTLSNENDNILAPIHIRIKPTNVCAHNCWYCSYKSDSLQLGKDMITKDYIPKDKMFEIINDCEEMGVKAITFSGGGDPFYYKYLLETIKKLKDTNISFASLTNGVNLTGEIAELFSKYGSWLRISIDGWDEESYSQYRDIKIGEFTKVISNMKNFKSLGGKCSLGVSFIIDNKNYLHIYDFIKLIKSTKADSIKISPCIVSDDTQECNNYHLPLYKEVEKQVALAKKDFEDNSFEIYNAYHLFEDEFEKTYQWCPYLQILPVIGADLNIYPCQDKAYNLDNGVVGSIKNISFKQFWFNDKNKFFKINPSCDCKNRCVADGKNKIILDYLNVDKDHLGFV